MIFLQRVFSRITAAVTLTLGQLSLYVVGDYNYIFILLKPQNLLFKCNILLIAFNIFLNNIIHNLLHIASI